MPLAQIVPLSSRQTRVVKPQTQPIPTSTTTPTTSSATAVAWCRWSIRLWFSRAMTARTAGRISIRRAFPLNCRAWNWRATT